MNKQELKQLLIIARSAITAAYGRASNHRITAYNKMGDNYVWVEVERLEYSTDWVLYKLKIEDSKVTYLNKGELK